MEDEGDIDAVTIDQAAEQISRAKQCLQFAESLTATLPPAELCLVPIVNKCKLKRGILEW